MSREVFDSYGVMFNTRANQYRKGADADAAAEEGTWLVAQLTIHVSPCNHQPVALH